jgi:hypothetical protein
LRPIVWPPAVVNLSIRKVLIVNRHVFNRSRLLADFFIIVGRFVVRLIVVVNLLVVVVVVVVFSIVRFDIVGVGELFVVDFSILAVNVVLFIYKL